MNPAIVFRGARLLFKFRRIIALAVILEFIIRHRLSMKNKKSRKQKDTQFLTEQNIGRAQHLLQDLKRQYTKR